MHSGHTTLQHLLNRRTITPDGRSEHFLHCILVNYNYRTFVAIILFFPSNEGSAKERDIVKIQVHWVDIVWFLLVSRNANNETDQISYWSQKATECSYITVGALVNARHHRRRLHERKTCLKKVDVSQK